MELPFTIVFEPPSQSELRALLRLRGTWVAAAVIALAIGTAAVVVTASHASADANRVLTTLEVQSRPAGAEVWLDGKKIAVTPATLSVDVGPHSVQFTTAEALETRYSVAVDGQSTATFGARLWRRQPGVLRLRSPLPGADLADVRLLADGQVLLVASSPADHLLQAWRLEPSSGVLRDIMPQTPAHRVGVSVDGMSVARVGADIGPSQSSPGSAGSAGGGRVVWLSQTGASGARRAWRPPLVGAERIADVSWSPHADRLLVVATEHDHPTLTWHSRVWLVDASTLDSRPLLKLPTRIVAGSLLWSPDGRQVAFLAHTTSATALCLVDSESGDFRYLADLDPTTADPLPYPPASWSDEGEQLMFVAARGQTVGQPLVWPTFDPRRSVYAARSPQRAPDAIAETDVEHLVWREDRHLLGLGRQSADGILNVRLVDRVPSAHLVDVPVRPAHGYAAVWDIPHAQLLIVNPSPSGREYWLVVLGVEVAA